MGKKLIDFTLIVIYGTSDAKYLRMIVKGQACERLCITNKNVSQRKEISCVSLYF